VRVTVGIPNERLAMPNVRERRTITFEGDSFATDDTIPSGQDTGMDGVLLPAAKTGVLTTRTDDDEGVITLTAGHGFSTGTYDIYWLNGCRYGVTLTISTNAATISGSTGDGDVLPAADTAVTVAAPQSETFSVPASGAQTILVYAPAGKLRVSFRTSVPALVFTVNHKGTEPKTYFWGAANGGASPLGSNAIATVFVSNGSTTAQTPVVKVTWND